MKVTHKLRTVLHIQNTTFVVLFLVAVGLIAWLSTRYHLQTDWTASGRNTLSEASVELLKHFDGPVQVDAFARESDLTPVRKHISDLLGRYQRHKPDLQLTFVNPDTAPDRVKAEGILVDGELVLRYGERKEHVRQLNEEEITNALQRLMRSGEQHIAFITGHGERAPHGELPYDLGAWAQELRNKGLQVGTINLGNTPRIPDDTTVLVIASPTARYLPGEVKLIQDYLERGGNLLWLAEPGVLHGLEPLAQQLGIQFYSGTVVDPTTQLLGLENAAFAIVAEYRPHPITQQFDNITIYPLAAAMRLEQDDTWERFHLLETVARSWSETGPLDKGSVRFDEGVDIDGPLTIGAALNRTHPTADDATMQQRVIVIGDGDFLSNNFLGNVGNLDLGMGLINWLSRDDKLINIPAKATPDTQLELTPTSSTVLGFAFLAIIPLLLLTSGTVIWLRRRRR